MCSGFASRSGAISILILGMVIAGCTTGSSNGAAGKGGSGTGGRAGSGGSASGGSAGGGAGTDMSGGRGGSTPDASAGGSGAGVAGGGATPDGGDSGPDGPSGDGALDGGADGDPAPYSACPDSGPCKILPLGDSITFGESSPSNVPGGYRVQLFHDALADHKQITFVGVPSQANGPAMVDGVPFPRDNAGYPGWNINMIAGLIPAPALAQSPHVILLMAGTNDRPGPADQAAQRLGTLIDKIVAAVPNALLAVAQIVPITDNVANKAFGPAFNALIPAMVQQRANAGKHLIVVDQYTTFDSSTMISRDNLHPNQLGYNHMGDVWYAAIKSALK